MKIAIITGLSGLDSELLDPATKFENIDYYALVDKIYNVKIWKQHLELEFSNCSNFKNRRNIKFAKILGFLLFPGYDFYIWHDHNCEVITDPKNIINHYLITPNKDIAVFKHKNRRCVYKELEMIRRWQTETEQNLKLMEEWFKDLEWPEDNGLYELKSFVYSNNHKTRTAMLSWWEIICRMSSRDQLSFPIIAQNHKLNLSILPGEALGNKKKNKFFPQVRTKTFK